MTTTPSAGDIWEWMEDGEFHLLYEKLVHYNLKNHRFDSLNLTNGTREVIIFSYPTDSTPGNIHRWRYVA